MNRRSALRLVFGGTLALALSGTVPFAGLTGPVSAWAEASAAATNAADLALRGQYEQAGAMALQSRDVAAQKLVEFIYLRQKWREAGYGRVMAFLNAAPTWPMAETFGKNAERLLYLDRADAAIVRAHFATRKPQTPEGALALARALLAQNNTAEARALIGKVWANETMDAAREQSVLAEFGSMISADDHRRRFATLIYQQESNAAIRNAKRLSGDYQNAARVAQLLLRGGAGADSQMAKLPGAMQKLPAMQYALARFYRKAHKEDRARTILLAAPSTGLSEAAAEAWWIEKRIVARKSVGVAHMSTVKQAYALARNHGNRDGEFYAEGEFLAGWISLRFLNDPATAMRHFQRLIQTAETRTDKARAQYWIGRAAEASGDKATAGAAFRNAAATPTVYYGQLAREKLGQGTAPIKIAPGGASAAARAKAENDEVVRAFQIVASTGRRAELYMFVWPISRRFKTVDEMNAAAAILQKRGGYTLSLKLAKAAGKRGIDIDDFAYPSRALPEWKQMGKPVERALVYGLSRQESEFDPRAGSRVGAQGLMQLMPGTAKIVAKQFGVPYSEDKLMDDPAYNVRLGAAHMADLIDDFGGSYVLTLVAYNAGPRRSREWVEDFGDPRSPSVDAIDWVESIPFQETRGYVQKVLQNAQVYRSRLAPGTMHPLSADLKRGGSGIIIAKASSEKGTCKAESDSIGALIEECD